MVLLNYTTMQMSAKIVYYGPGLCGKTTNLQYIHQKTAPRSRGEMVSLETESDRTLFFDLLPLDVGVVGGMKVRLQLYTVPGQVFYNTTRKLVLKGVDGIVFVADSQKAMVEPNVESLRNLKENLKEIGLLLEEIPTVFQYNKRDIRSILTIEELNESLNPRRLPYYEAAALHGVGVFETLKGISRLTLHAIRESAEGEADPRKTAPPAPPQAPPSPPASERPAPRARGAATARTPSVPKPPPPRPAPPSAPPTPAAATGVDPLGHLVAAAPPVEFAEEDTDKHYLRPVRTKAPLDVQEELQKLRTLTGRKPAAKGGTSDVDRRLQDILGPSKGVSHEVRRKATVEVPAKALREAASIRIHLGLPGPDGEARLPDAVRVDLGRGTGAGRITLHLEIELKAK